MTTATLSPIRARLNTVPGWAWPILIALPIYAIISFAIVAADPDADVRVRLSLAPLIDAGMAVQIHVAAAIMTLVIGIVLLSAPKGFGLHRTLGWAWVIAMGATALSSFFIMEIFERSLSPIHALSAWTMVALPMGLAAIRRRDVATHRKTMTNMFVGGIVVAGLFSMLPGRMMWHVFFTA